MPLYLWKELMPRDEGFSATLRREAGPIWKKIFDHPSLKELQEGSRYEHLFWDMAYRGESWPI